ncbi:hypothetical protein like AT5G64420 [Hibiscus trionum]|uniref:DNA polymerase V n=1 Tax=Hibiscus trionum TaxID=183268 RepID=A0A9W7JJL7_HIBTR|nr:hypothetical protein like AT5G64420 [Hibiscus trionum]
MARQEKKQNSTVLMPSNKKIKMCNNKDADMGNGVMERINKRKPIDMERQCSVFENDEPRRKRMDSSCLPEFHINVFKDLASADSSVREAAVESIVTELQEVQKEYHRLKDMDLVECGLKLEAQMDDGLDNCAPSLRYALRRMIYGVSSSREYVRQGFALGLTTLVAKIPSIKVDSLLKLIVNLLDVSSSMKGQDVKDCLLGRLFAYGALARSDRLANEWLVDKDTLHIKGFTSAVISLARKKRYLQEPAVSIILEIVDKLPAEALLDHILEAPGITQWFQEAVDVGNPDALLLALKIREKIPIDSTSFGNLLPNPFNSSKLFSADYLSSIVNCVKESTYCQPRIHSLWPFLVNTLLPDAIIEEIAKNVQCFCEVVIEGSLLVSSHDRKHLAFDIMLLLLPRLPSSFIPIVLSYKLIKCLIDVLSTKDSWLYKVVRRFLKELLDWVQNDDVRRVAVIVAFQKHSNGKFDCITKTRTIRDLMAKFKTETGCMLIVENLNNLFLDEGHVDDSEISSIEEYDSIGLVDDADFLKGWIIESLPGVLKHLKSDPEAKFRVQKEILKFLAVQGLFSASFFNEVFSFELEEKFRWPKAITSSALCRMCIEKLQSLLANVHKVSESRSLANGLQNDLCCYFTRLFRTLYNIPSVLPFRTLNDEDEQAVEKLLEMESKLYKEERNCDLNIDANKLHALRCMLILLLLQVLLRPREFSDAASKLIICCKNVSAACCDLSSNGEDDLDSDPATELTDVLVDTLVSLPPRSSAPIRSAIEQVFRYFCGNVTDDGLMRMLRIIKKDARHPEADSEDDDDDDEDANNLGAEEEEDVDEAESNGESDDSEALVGADEDDEELNEASDDSDGGMDDEAMFRMDAYIAEIFKHKAGGETAQSQLVLLKFRVLSLLEIYLLENQGKPQVLTVYSNLAQSFVDLDTSESSEQLGQRIWGILQRKILKEKKLPADGTMQLSVLESLLEKNLKLASKSFKIKKSTTTLSKKELLASLNRRKLIGSLARDSTYWILKIIEARSYSESELKGVYGILKCTLVQYFESKRSGITPAFVKEIFRRHPRIRQRLLGSLLRKCSSAKSDFRRVEALDLVIEVLKSLVPMTCNRSNRHASKKILKRHLRILGRLIKMLVTRMPETKSKKTEVHKFCGKIFRMISTQGLTKAFLRCLGPDAHAACESQLGPLLLNFERNIVETHMAH